MKPRTEYAALEPVRPFGTGAAAWIGLGLLLIAALCLSLL